MTIETPAALVDLAVLRENARRVGDYAARHGLRWRPHVKTHKSPRIARIQLEAGASGLTVATPREAEVMAEICDDLLLAHPPLGEARLRRVLSLPPHVRLTVALDHEGTLEDLAREAARVGRTVGVMVEADMGLGRMGVSDPAAAVALASRAASLEGVRYRGLLFYPGHLRSPDDEPAFSALVDRSGRILDALSAAGLPPEVVSGGSTPLLWRSHELPGLTEIRAGSAIFNDREALDAGVAGPGDLAYTVLATVVSTAVPGRAVTDAGSKALAKEPPRSGLEGFGCLLDRPEVTLLQLSEEHGVLDLSRTDWRPSVGDRVRIVPNHVCVSVNLHERLVVLDGEGAEAWPVEARGRLPVV